MQRQLERPCWSATDTTKKARRSCPQPLVRHEQTPPKPVQENRSCLRLAKVSPKALALGAQKLLEDGALWWAMTSPFSPKLCLREGLCTNKRQTSVISDKLLAVCNEGLKWLLLGVQAEGRNRCGPTDSVSGQWVAVKPLVPGHSQVSHVATLLRAQELPLAADSGRLADVPDHAAPAFGFATCRGATPFPRAPDLRLWLHIVCPAGFSAGLVIPRVGEGGVGGICDLSSTREGA